jgi:tRNA(fMet)-specific endonuclease VapC
MILLDTDHLTVLRFRQGERCARLVARMEAAENETFGTTIVNIAEQMKGWLAAVNKERQAIRQVTAYRELARLFEFFSSYRIAPFDETAARRFDELRKAKIRVGTSDLKIAAVALTYDALLLTANRQDFELVPGLRFANWIDDP